MKLGLLQSLRVTDKWRAAPKRREFCGLKGLCQQELEVGAMQ